MGNAVIESPAGQEQQEKRAAALKRDLARRAREAGFDSFGVTAPDAAPKAGARLDAFLRAGWHGDMAWMSETAARRRDPRALWPQVQSIIMLGANYGPAGDPLALLNEPSRGAISAYARGKDYHDILKKRLKVLARWLHGETARDVKIFVDTAPVMEKPLAEAAGLGWQGKHTNLVSRSFGSWLFLGAIFTAAWLPRDRPERDHCGTCQRCLDICPTEAFPAPYQLDARRCIAYLTIEYKGHIPSRFRRAIGNRVFGCDDCLAVCPWNKFAQVTREARFRALPLSEGAPLADLLALDEATFRAAFAGSPVKRTGRDRFIRNVLIAAGNSGDPALLGQIEALLRDPSALVRAMAVWAARQLIEDEAAWRTLRAAHLPCERDEAVCREWGVEEAEAR